MLRVDPDHAPSTYDPVQEEASLFAYARHQAHLVHENDSDLLSD